MGCATSIQKIYKTIGEEYSGRVQWDIRIQQGLFPNSDIGKAFDMLHLYLHICKADSLAKLFLFESNKTEGY